MPPTCSHQKAPGFESQYFRLGRYRHRFAWRFLLAVQNVAHLGPVKRNSPRHAPQISSAILPLQCKGRRERRLTKTIRGKDEGEKQAERQEGKHRACHTRQPRVRSRKRRACHQKGCNWRPMCQKVGTASNSKAKKGEKTGANERQAGREAAPRSQTV